MDPEQVGNEQANKKRERKPCELETLLFKAAVLRSNYNQMKQDLCV